MPQLDKTGPMGQGSQTGRKRGQCDEETAVAERPMRGRGFRYRLNSDNEQRSVQGFGMGRGCGRALGKGRKLGFGRNSETQN